MTLETRIIDEAEFMLKKTNCSDKTIHGCLAIMHLLFPSIGMLLVLFGNKTMVVMTIIATYIILCLFIVFDGCILTRLENRFCNGNITIIDPFLRFLNIPVTYKNRLNYTRAFMVFLFIMEPIIYYLRFR